MQKIIVLFFMLVASAYGSDKPFTSFKCMLSCSRSDCADSSKRFAWCLTYCVNFLNYRDLRSCAEAFFDRTIARGKTCEARIAASLKGPTDGVPFFCEVVDRLLLQERSDEEGLRRSLLMRALQEVPNLRALSRRVLVEKEK